jgi:putative redox protein
MAKADSNHWIPLDTEATSGGTGGANNPFQLFLIGVGACSLVDVVDILTKGRKSVRELALDVEVKRAETHPKIVRAAHYHFRIAGDDITADAARRAIELSLTKYCSASLSLDRSVTFTVHLTLNGEAFEPRVVPRDPDLYRV